MYNLGVKCAVLICIASIDRCIYYMYPRLIKSDEI